MGRGTALLHVLTDVAVGRAFRAGLLYRRGFGDRAELERLVGAVVSYSRERVHEPIRLSWHGERSIGPATVRAGDFVSTTDVPLPDESRRAAVELWLPRGKRGGPLCLLLAATGEEGFRRRASFAAALCRAGIGALLLENPFYGARRRRGQHGPALTTVFDQFAMNLATVDEARALIAWAQAEGYGPLGVTGYSQGGFMAAFAGALVDVPLVVVPRGAGTSAAPVFTSSALSHAVHWPSLAREAGSEREARAALVAYLEPVDISKHPPPIDARLSTIVVVRHDRFVPPESGLALHRHWPGSTLVWSEAGHVTSAVLDTKAHATAVIDAFARFRQ